MRAVVVLIVLWTVPALTSADERGAAYDRRTMEAVSLTDPIIMVNINPEARASAVMAGKLPAASPCGTATEISVKILNQAFVTARLEAELVDEVTADVSLTFQSEPLKGTPEEIRRLHVSLSRPGQMDITVAFKLHNEIPDLGGRNRVHFLLSCVGER